MASNRLSFVIALKFLTENFNRQATRVKSQLYTLQRNFLALASAAGAGAIGLSNFASKMIDTAKKTSQASIALQNVSGSMKAYAENQQWLLGIAKKYGVEINSLTTGFAKFKAAADISNMSMADQRKIFESVSRATVAFGLSQEDQKGVFMALSQMMSKNKVMAEELRLQLAERMPVAIQAMAKAAGVTVNELDALMKQGKVLSSEVLPKFADALTEMTPNVNLDNLNKSLTDLSNTFTALTKELGVEQAFKSMVDGANRALQGLVENVKTVMSAISSLIVVGIGRLLNSSVFALISNSKRAESAAVKAVEAHARAKKRLANAEASYGKNSTQYTKALNSYERAQSKITTEVRLRNLAAYHKGWKSIVFSVRAGIASISASFKAFVASNIITLITSAIYAMAQNIAKAASAARELKNMVKTAGDVDLPQEAKDLDYWQGLLHHKDSEVREGAMQKINELLGTQLNTEKEINEEILKRQRYLLAEAKLQQANERLSEIAAQKRENKSPTAEKKAEWANATSIFVQQRTDALAEMAKYGRSTSSSTSTFNASGGGAGTAKIPVISLTIDEDDVAATMEQLQDTIFANEAEAKRKQAFAMQHRGQSILNSTRDTSGDWKLSPTEILEADKIFAEEKVAKLIAFAEETGNDMAVAIQEGIAKAGTLEEAIKGAELADALKTAQAELSEAKLGLFEGAVDNIDGMVSAISRLNDALEKDSSAWEVLAASVEVFKSLMSGVIETIQSVTALKEASAQAQMLASQKNATTAMGEAMAEGTASAAKLPWPANLAAIGSIVATILSVFSMIPKFAKGGVVGGNSTQGDKVLARLNSGEGVLTAVGMQSLHDASNPANNRNIRVTGVLVGEGRTLKAIIDKEVKYLTLTK